MLNIALTTGQATSLLQQAEVCAYHFVSCQGRILRKRSEINMRRHALEAFPLPWTGQDALWLLRVDATTIHTSVASATVHYTQSYLDLGLDIRSGLLHDKSFVHDVPTNTSVRLLPIVPSW